VIDAVNVVENAALGETKLAIAMPAEKGGRRQTKR
jgi:hypothetical protein